MRAWSGSGPAWWKSRWRFSGHGRLQPCKPSPYAMGFAAGAMLYVISDEIIPETHRKGHERAATMGLMAGSLVMLYLDVTLG